MRQNTKHKGLHVLFNQFNSTYYEKVILVGNCYGYIFAYHAHAGAK